MSKYTTELRFICESLLNYQESKGYNDTNSIITKSAPKIFSFSFPIFDNNYKLPLEIKIIRHYYTREICEETYGLWKLRLEATMNEIMPYYNQLYESELIKFNPLYDVDLTTKHDKTNDETAKETTSKTDDYTKKNTGTQTNTEDDWNAYSDTPQGTLSNIESMRYLTNAEHDDNRHVRTDNLKEDYSEKGTGKRDNVIKNTEDFLQHVYGKSGGVSYSRLLKEFRETFLNIDMMIIEELQDLFFKLW